MSLNLLALVPISYVIFAVGMILPLILKLLAARLVKLPVLGLVLPIGIPLIAPVLLIAQAFPFQIHVLLLNVYVSFKLGDVGKFNGIF